ncbi:MAG TPA: DUF6491 family protein [Caulobacteraceae bacterium]|nr:DUF6491 family protein [Caulobacteraceae bacterium]
MTLMRIGLWAAAAIALAGPTAARKPHAADQCFLASNVQNFSAPDTRTVYIRVGVNDIWRLDLMTECLDLPFREHLGFERAGSDPWICHPLQATIVSREAGVPQRCPVASMHRLTPEAVAALPKSLRP